MTDYDQHSRPVYVPNGIDEKIQSRQNTILLLIVLGILFFGSFVELLAPMLRFMDVD